MAFKSEMAINGKLKKKIDEKIEKLNKIKAPPSPNTPYTPSPIHHKRPFPPGRSFNGDKVSLIF